MEGISGTSQTEPRSKSFWASGWILVTVLVVLCVLGTWLTAHGYKQRVFSSAKGVVLENQWPESRISVPFSENEASSIRPGQLANITLGSDTRLIQGVVASVSPGPESAKDSAIVIVRVVGDAGEKVRTGSASSRKSHHYLPVGAACSVTIDTTIPPEALKEGSLGAHGTDYPGAP